MFKYSCITVSQTLACTLNESQPGHRGLASQAGNVSPRMLVRQSRAVWVCLGQCPRKHNDFQGKITGSVAAFTSSCQWSPRGRGVEEWRSHDLNPPPGYGGGRSAGRWLLWRPLCPSYRIHYIQPRMAMSHRRSNTCLVSDSGPPASHFPRQTHSARL